MTHSEVTPGAPAVRIAVSDRTVRRMAEAYEEVYGPLPCNQRGHRPAVRLGPGRSAYRVSAAGLLDFVTHYGHHSPTDVADSGVLDSLVRVMQ